MNPTSIAIIILLSIMLVFCAGYLMRAVRQRDEAQFLNVGLRVQSKGFQDGWSEAETRIASLQKQNESLGVQIAGRLLELEKCDTQNQDYYARLQRAEKELGSCQNIVEGNNQELKKLRLQVNALHEFCPDHRDKQKGKACLACTLETVRNKVQGARKLSSDDPRVLHGVSFMDGVLEFIASQSHRHANVTHKKTATGSHVGGK